MTLNVTIKLPSEGFMINETSRIVRQVLDRAIFSAAPRIKMRLKSLITTAITESPEYISLTTGRLYHEIGVPDVQLRLTSIIDIWTNSIQIIPKKVKFTSSGIIKGGLNITAIDSSWRDVLTQEDASFVTAKGSVLPWLDWLLTYGNRIMVRDYDVILKRTASSRTGRGIMIRGGRRRWKVPAEFTGTPRNNFVTRALDSVVPLIESLIETEIIKGIK